MSARFLLKACAVAFLGGLALAAGCAHNTFETCLRQRALSRVEQRVAYALACGKDMDCFAREGAADLLAYAGDVAMCDEANNPAPAQDAATGGQGGSNEVVLYFNGPAQEI